MSTETLPLPVETAADPFYIGYRYVKSAGPGGREAVPLSIEDFLHPQEEDRFMLTDGHARAVHYLRDAIQIAAESRPDVRVFTEHRVDWQVPGILPHGPDVVAFDHFLADWDPLKGTLPVRDLGAGVMAVVEVTSESTRATDFEAKFLEYHAAGIPYYVILDAAGPPGVRGSWRSAARRRSTVRCRVTLNSGCSCPGSTCGCVGKATRWSPPPRPAATSPRMSSANAFSSPSANAPTPSGCGPTPSGCGPTPSGCGPTPSGCGPTNSPANSPRSRRVSTVRSKGHHMPTELPKSFDAKAAQARWLAHWEAKGYFTADPTKPGEAFTIVIPPPNVTGALHMGHALNGTLQDVLVRRKRMQGFNALWVPGTDHAGIATQAVVEKLVFATEKKTRHDLGRDALVAKIWAWKDQYAARILGQLRELGASLDWSRTRFTLDETCARAVRETFFKLFRDDLIYRGKRLVNWDTQLQTSVADDETYTEAVKGGFWTFRYPVVGLPDGSDPAFIEFSTTRPETMLGDTALCVHPDDPRYTSLHGLKALQPLTGREIPIITDALLADPALGTGCVKVTPAHDANDYACWTRHPEIGVINILNPDGTVNSAGGPKYAGLDRAKARELVTADMDALGYFVGKQDRDIPLPFSDRSKTPIEPYLSDQWFVAMGERDGKPGLAQTAMDAVTSGRVRFTPERYAKTYLDWLGEKRDWCVSRQLWWGHRIPVWSRTTTVIPNASSIMATLRSIVEAETLAPAQFDSIRQLANQKLVELTSTTFPDSPEYVAKHILDVDDQSVIARIATQSSISEDGGSTDYTTPAYWKGIPH